MERQAARLRISNGSSISLLAADPDLAAAIPEADLPLARRSVIIPAVTLTPGVFDPRALQAAGRGVFAGLITSGLVTREISIDGQAAGIRLLGPGDLLAPTSSASVLSGTDETWTTATETHVAILEERTSLAARRWPGLLAAICSLLGECHDRTLLQLVISHRPAAEDRVLSLFELLAASWGRVTPDGIVVPFPLTHQMIGQMIGARRPTVSLALRALAQAGRLERAGGHWLLANGGRRPAEESAQLHALVGA